MKRIPVFLLLFFFGCSNPIGPKVEFADALEKWNSFRFNNYSFTFQQSCFCPDAGFPLRVTVKNKSVNSVINLDTNEPVHDIRNFYSIEGLFQLVNEALDNADKIRVTYNSLYGFPEDASIDYHEQAVDDEYGFTVTNFEY